MSETKLSKEFAAGWIHFCDCIDFGRSALDADAIRFMNETPGKVVQALKQQNELLEDVAKWLDSHGVRGIFKGKQPLGLPSRKKVVDAINSLVAKAKKE